MIRIDELIQFVNMSRLEMNTWQNTLKLSKWHKVFFALKSDSLDRFEQVERSKTHDLNHDLTFSAHTINCVCYNIRSMFRVLGIYNFDWNTKTETANCNYIAAWFLLKNIFSASKLWQSFRRSKSLQGQNSKMIWNAGFFK